MSYRDTCDIIYILLVLSGSLPRVVANVGHGILITEHADLLHYVTQLFRTSPIESGLTGNGVPGHGVRPGNGGGGVAGADFLEREAEAGF